MRRSKRFIHINDESGYSLVELILTFAILTIMSYIAVPKFTELSNSFDRLNARSNLLQDLKRAQAESLTKGCRGIFLIDADGRGYRFGCDFLGYDPSPAPSPDQISFRRKLPEEIVISAGAEIIFDSRGHSVDADNVISNVTINLSMIGEASPFMSGTLLGTGLFTTD